MLFYEGNLQSGIALALRESKRVICFVRDDGEESKNWENTYLADNEISSLIARTSVTLRLAAGSQEAGFLSSFCPISKVPTLVVINNGVLQEYIVSGTSQEEFKRRLKMILEGPNLSVTPQPSTPQQQEEPEAPAPPPPRRGPVPGTGGTRVYPPHGNPEAAAGESTADRLRREAIRAGKKRAESAEPASPAKEPQVDYKDQRRKREQKEQEERERIRGRIRHDNEERKAKDERVKQTHLPKDSVAHVSDQTRKTSAPTSAAHFRIQVRLLDGSTIRSTFSPSQTVRSGLRSWIDQQRSDGDAPYILKQILTPLPNRNIAVAEEEQTLRELGLGPTASLVMVPVQTYAKAYASGSSSAPVRTLHAAYSWVASIIAMVFAAILTFLGVGRTRESESQQHPSQANQAEASSSDSNPRRPNIGHRTGSSNIRTLHDSRADRGSQQFYNGNQLNFEPRRDQDTDANKDD